MDRLINGYYRRDVHASLYARGYIYHSMLSNTSSMNTVIQTRRWAG